MHFLLLTQGSRGDVQPFVTLATRLMQAGHSVQLGAPPDFAGLAAAYGVDFVPVGIGVMARLNSPEGKEAIESGNILKRIRFVRSMRAELNEKLNRESWQAAQGADAVLYWMGMAVGYNVAEKLGVPRAEVAPFPMIPTREFPAFLLGGGQDRGALLNRLVWRVNEQLLWQVMLRGGTNQQRREILDLPPLPFFGPRKRQEREGMPVFHAYSPSVLPRPADWPDRVHVTGYYFAEPPPGWEPPADLLRFLESGPPPVYIGFGSMPNKKPEETRDLILRALELTAQRGIIQRNLAGDAEGLLPESVYAAGDLPHSWLFPRMAAVVHHGGAGTTGMGLRSGVPSIIKPFSADQPSWAREVQRLGAGPAPLPRNDFTAEQLAEAIHTASTDKNMRERAAELGRRIQAEDGPGRTIELFMQYAERFRRGG
jgi:sterol 3beta-glucosyltransferase